MCAQGNIPLIVPLDLNLRSLMKVWLLFPPKYYLVVLSVFFFFLHIRKFHVLNDLNPIF